MTLAAERAPRVIDSRPPGVLAGVREAWRHRELLLLLARRDLALRYKQTALGVLWVVLQPALYMLVFSIFFGRLAGVPSDGMPYPVFVLCGLVPWQLFSFALVQSSASLIENERLITKVYFPRILIPIASTLAGLVDFLVSLVLLLLVAAAYGVPLSAGIAATPLLAVLALAAALSAGLWFAALNVEYRDFRYTVPFLVQLALFVSPVAYPSSLVPPAWQWLYGLNPMAGLIDLFRWAILGTAAPAPAILIPSLAVTLLALVAAIAFFERRQRSFADTL